MTPTVPLETFTLTLHVPRTISDVDAASLLRLMRRKSFRTRLRNALAEFLRQTPPFAAVGVSVTHSD